MADGRGAKSTAAIIKATTWGTPVECGAGEGLLIDSSGIVGGKEVIPDRSLTGQVFGNAPVVGAEMHRGNINAALRYGANCEKLLAGWMGVAGAPTQVEATYEYTHLLAIEEVLGDVWTYVELKVGIRDREGLTRGDRDHRARPGADDGRIPHVEVHHRRHGNEHKGHDGECDGSHADHPRVSR